jgi:hypothetical protein
MKKTTKKPLRLAIETIRILDNDRLVHAAGGGSVTCERSSTEAAQSCNGSCICGG